MVYKDAYTGQVVEHQERAARPSGGLSKRSKRTNDRCVADQVAELQAFLHREGLGSFAELDKCMARLKREDEVAWSHVRRHYQDGWQPPTLADALGLDRGLCCLSEWMPREVRVPAFVFALEELGRGRSVGQTARSLGVSRRTIRKYRRAA